MFGTKMKLNACHVFVTVVSKNALKPTVVQKIVKILLLLAKLINLNLWELIQPIYAALPKFASVTNKNVWLMLNN
jgi:hypothetical protein